MSFPEFEASDELFVSSKKVEEFMKDDELPVMSDFPEVFPDHMNDLPLECEVEFIIDLVPSTSLVSVAPYRMSSS